MLLALAALFAVGVASWLFGSGWVWPGGVPAAFRELGGLISGRAGHGLDHTAGRVGLYTLLVIAELLAIGVAVLIARMATQTFRPTDARSGLASRAEASAALGRERLTKQRAAEIRPDLYPGGRASRSRRDHPHRAGVGGVAARDVASTARRRTLGAV